MVISCSVILAAVKRNSYVSLGEVRDVYREINVCLRRHHGDAYIAVSAISQSLLDMVYVVYRFQLLAEFVYGVLSTDDADEEIWHENRGRACSGGL